MDLETARAWQKMVGDAASVLEISLFGLVATLELYMPFLPQALFDKVRLLCVV